MSNEWDDGRREPPTWIVFLLVIGLMIALYFADFGGN